MQVAWVSIFSRNISGEIATFGSVRNFGLNITATPTYDFTYEVCSFFWPGSNQTLQFDDLALVSRPNNDDAINGIRKISFEFWII